MLRRLHLTLLCLFIGTCVWSQKNLTKAQRQFELKAFDLAIEDAKRAVELKPDCMECHYIIAESFRLKNQNVDASIWYRKMEKFKKLPDDYYLNYGLLMKKMGQYDKAKSYFENYKTTDETVAEHYIESCDFAKAILSEEINFELNLDAVSSTESDFGASIFKNNLVYSSFRSDIKRTLEKLNESVISPAGPQLFKTAMSEGKDESTFLLHDNEETYDLGPVHYASAAPLCTVTKNNFKDGEQQIFSDDLELTLYLAEVEHDGSFNKIKPYPYNEVGYATGFGTLNPAGNILYFASNRPGGFGGFDLYVSYYKNDDWTYPENLGPRINSQGNEVTPYFDGTQLYFSSDFHKGLGGLDVFRSEVYEGSWITPINMGNGVNSPEDDFYFLKHPEKEHYYITSNRIGGEGSYDIYNVIKAEIIDEPVELSYEDVTPAEVNISEDIVDAFDAQPEYKQVKLEEEPVEEILTTEERPVSIQETIKLKSAEMSGTNTAVETEIESVPEAISYEAEANTEITETETDFSAIESVPEAEVINTNAEVKSEIIDFTEVVAPKSVEIDAGLNAMVSLEGAKRVSFGEVILDHTRVYFIQLAALFKSSGNISNFFPLRQFGSIYKMKQSNAIKVKLGYFMDETQAKNVLQEVKRMGYADAFITHESLNTDQLELVELSDMATQNYVSEGYLSETTTGVNYKVRLASYEDPIWFDITSVKDLGVIEQWSKDKWTIFILSGFNNVEDAQKTKLIAQNRGFRDAEVVVDRDGILEKYK